MPIYEYACGSCKDEFELLVRGGETPACPKCGSDQLQRQMSVVSAHSSGSRELPTCAPPSPGGCGLPQCGGGQCGGM